MIYQVKQCSGTFKNLTSVKLDQLNANTHSHFCQLYSGLDLVINNRVFLQYSTMFQLSNSTRLFRKKKFFPIKNFNKLLKFTISVPYRRSTFNKRSSRESLECCACDKITKSLHFIPSPP